MSQNQHSGGTGGGDIAGVASEWRAFTIINGVAAGLLLLALADLPYGYYVLLRWVVPFVAIASSVRRFGNGSKGYGSLLLLVAVVFNPLIPLHLGREVWAVVDVVAAFILLASEFVPPPGMTLRRYLEIGEKERQPRSSNE